VRVVACMRRVVAPPIGGVHGMFGRTPSRKEKPHMVQPRIERAHFRRRQERMWSISLVSNRLSSSMLSRFQCIKLTVHISSTHLKIQKHGECESIVYYFHSISYISD
jgi:hypothetical protein